MTIKQFDVDMQKRFERYLSLNLRSALKIKRNSDGSAKVEVYNPGAISDDDSGYAFNTNLLVQGNLGIGKRN